MRKTIKPSLLLTLGAAVLVIGGGAVAYWLLVQRNILGGNVPVGAELVPQNALVAVSISTDSEQWQQLQQYGTPETQAAFSKQLQQLNDNLLTTNGLNYQQDIQPWIGKEVTIAYLSSVVGTPNSSSSGAIPLAQPSMVMVLPIDNAVLAQQLLEKAKSRQQGKLVERTYKDVQIRETQSTSSQTLSTAVLGRSLVVTTDPRATERAIDTAKGEPSLAITPGYSDALGKIKAGQPFAHLYFNVPVAAAVAAANSARSLSPENLANLQQNQGLAATVTLEPEGIQFKGISWLKPNSTKKHVVENNAKIMAKRLPGETLMMMSGGNLQRLWQNYVQGAQSNPIVPLNPQDFRAAVKSRTSLDWEQDLLPWMAGEFSVSLIPAPPGSGSNLSAGVVVMVQASDRSLAEKSFKQLDEFVATKYKFLVQPSQLKGQTVVNWISPLGGVTSTHGWLDGNVAFLTMGANIASEFAPQPTARLEDQQLFKQAVPTALNSKNGHFFIDVDRTINAGNLTLTPFIQNFKPVMAGIRAIGVTGAISDEYHSRFDIFVALKKLGEPRSNSNPFPSPQITPILPPDLKSPRPSPQQTGSPGAEASPTLPPAQIQPLPTPSATSSTNPNLSTPSASP